MLGSYEHIGGVIQGILTKFDWKIVTLLYHNHGEETGRGHSGNSIMFDALGSWFTKILNEFLFLQIVGLFWAAFIAMSKTSKAIKHSSMQRKLDEKNFYIF